MDWNRVSFAFNLAPPEHFSKLFFRGRPSFWDLLFRLDKPNTVHRLIGYEAFKKTTQYRNHEIIAGLNPDQRFFLGYELACMINERPEAVVNQVRSDVHPPAKLRVIGPLSDRPEFYSAFGIKKRRRHVASREPAGENMVRNKRKNLIGFLDDLIKKFTPSVGNALGGNSELLNSVTQHLNLGKTGGLANLVNTFQKKGFGDIVNSWVSTGKNLPISPDQIQKALGSGTVKNLAAQLGLSHTDAASQLSSLLPTLVDKLTPSGKLPE
jgi:uncharacterized protein YidB (DUF937 family)